MKFLIDSSVWMDYLLGTSVTAQSIIDEADEIFILNLNICEMTSKLLRKGIDPKPYMNRVRLAATVLSVDGNEEKIGAIHARMRESVPNFGMVDAALMVIADVHSLTIVAKDSHFKDYKKVKIVK